MEATEDLVHKPLKGLCRPKGIRRNSNRPKGVAMAVFYVVFGQHELIWPLAAITPNPIELRKVKAVHSLGELIRWAI